MALSEFWLTTSSDKTYVTKVRPTACKSYKGLLFLLFFHVNSLPAIEHILFQVQHLAVLMITNCHVVCA